MVKTLITAYMDFCVYEQYLHPLKTVHARNVNTLHIPFVFHIFTFVVILSLETHFSYSVIMVFWFR